jgi:excinuclease ABC subunit C
MIARAKSQIAATQLAFDVGPVDGDVTRLREQVRATATNVPGVYLMRGAHGEVLYVGKSSRLRSRVLSYFRLPWPEHRHARMLRETARIEFEHTPSEFAALVREVRLIRGHLPRYNARSARPLDKWWMITIADGVAPRLRVQRASAVARLRDRTTLIGPFTQRRPLTEALRVLNDALGLRDCADRVPMVLRDAGDLFDESEYPRLARTPACHRYETRRCLGPCVAACSSSEYRVQVNRARAVLEGRDDEPRQRLLQDMAAASAALEYERAGWLRSRLVALEDLEEQLSRVRGSLVRPPFLYRVPSAIKAGTDRVYLIRHGIVAAEASADDVDAIKDMEQQCQSGVGVPTGIHANALDEMLTIAQWFRTHPEGLVVS